MKVKFIISLVVALIATTAAIFFIKKEKIIMVNSSNKIDRLEASNEKYKELFGSYPNPENEIDPELMLILRKNIFGDVFSTGVIDDKMRELITVTVLATMQTLPQLKSHLMAALNIGIEPVVIREAIYQLSPFIGFPKTLNAVAVMNEVFEEKNINLKEVKNSTTNDDNRYEKGFAIQNPIYGDEIKNNLANLPGNFKDFVPNMLTTFAFGDFYTRKDLDIKTRELLILVTLTAMGMDKQIKSHILGNLKVGNSKETITAAIVQALPYIGFPNAFKALYVINDL